MTMVDEELDAKRGNQAYAPPAAEPEAQLLKPSEAARRAGYRPQTALVRVIVALYGVYTLSKGVGVVVDVLMATHSDPAFGDATLAWGNQVVIASQFVRLPALLAFYALLVIANKNARLFLRAEPETIEPNAETDEQDQADDEDSASEHARPRRPRRRAMPVEFFSPASMVWWYFVPVMNLFRPYQALKAVWSTSTPLAREKDADALPLYWWWFWLGSVIMLQSSGLRIRLGSAYVVRDMILLLVNVTDAISCLLTIELARALEARQRRRAAELWG